MPWTDTAGRLARCIVDCHNRTNFLNSVLQNIEGLKIKQGRFYSFESLQLLMELEIAKSASVACDTIEVSTYQYW